MAIEIFVDGACRGQGDAELEWKAACAFVAFDKRKKIAQFARALGSRTNNEAEYEALIHALLAARSLDLKDPIIYSDSKVVVNQVNKKWECKTEGLVPLLHTVRTLQEGYRFKLVHVERRFVHEADFLVNECLDDLYGKKVRKKKSDG